MPRAWVGVNVERPESPTMRVPLRVSCTDAAALAAAMASGADTLVLDLSEAASPGDRSDRRGAAARILVRRRSWADPSSPCPLLVIRVAPLSSGLVDGDLDAVMAGAPDAILLRGAVGAIDVQHLAAKLAVREAERGLVAGRTRIVAMAADTARGVLALPSIPGASPRLLALGWDPDALARDLGREGADTAPGALARGLLLTTAAAARVPALDSGAPDSGDTLAKACEAAYRDGFSGKLALDPDQVGIIATHFAPRWLPPPR